jgi:hypothetical protein
MGLIWLRLICSVCRLEEENQKGKDTNSFVVKTCGQIDHSEGASEEYPFLAKKNN